MAIHDAYARTTPFELAFPAAERTRALTTSAFEEASVRGVDPTDRTAFVMLGAVGAFVRELQGPDAAPEAIHGYGALIYHSCHFVRAGMPLVLVAEGAARSLVASGCPAGAPSPPMPAGYAQLPRNLFWMDGAPAASADPAARTEEPPSASAPGRAEAIDGFFWTLGDDGLLRLLFVTGIRPDRPGFGTVIVPEASWSEALGWFEGDARAVGPDFATTLPGGEIEGLHSLTTAGEALKLAARLLILIGADEPAPLRRAEQTEGGPPPSTLPYWRIETHAEGIEEGEG